MTINWFPGHMNKARREISAAMGQTDVVIEVLDARLPFGSGNPMLAELRGDRPCVRVLNKADLADADVTRQWLAEMRGDETVRALAVRSTVAADVRAIPALCRELVPGRSGPGKPVRALVVGIPNVGKSTLINSLKGRRVAEVANRPAVTRRRQRVDLDLGFSLSDTPGVLWPKLEDQTAAHCLAATGSIGEAAFDPFDVALFALVFLRDRYPRILAERYKLDALEGEPQELLEGVARARGFLLRGGRLDIERAADVFLRELRSGKLGRISFERPGDPRDPDEDAAPSSQRTSSQGASS
jgi:ribosome biogenesis GTPase A